MLLRIVAIFLLVYGVFLLFSGFAKVKFMVNLAKGKLGKNATDKGARTFMYISGLVLLVAGIVTSVFAF